MAFPSTGPAQQVPPRMPPRGDPNVVPPTEITGFNIGQYRFRLGESKYDEVRSLLVRPVSGRGPAWADAQPAPWLPRGRVIEWNGSASDGFGVSFDNMKLVFDESQTLIAHFVTMGTGDLVSLSNIFQMRQAALEQRYTLMGATPRDWSQVGAMTITPEVPRGISFRGPGVFGTLAPTPQRLLIESFVTVEMAQRAGLAKAPLPPTPNASPQGANPLLGSWVLAGEAGPLCDRIKDIRFEPERIVRSNFGDQMVRYIPVGNLLWRVDPLSANDFFRWSFEVLAPDRLRLVELDCEFVRRR